MSVKNKNTEEKWLFPFCMIEDATAGNTVKESKSSQNREIDTKNRLT